MTKQKTSTLALPSATTLNGVSNEFPERLLRRPDVCQMTTLPSSSLTDLISKGDFPAPLKISERSSAWKLSEILAWIESRHRAA